MQLEEFLKANVEDYLLEDLGHLLKVAPNGWDGGGGLGYPIVLTAFAGIELLGELTWPTTRPKDGVRAKAFQAYWSRYLYPSSSNAEQVGKTLYELVRHPVAHTFVLRARLAIAFNAPEYHLRTDRDGGAYIDARQLALDFAEAYENRFRPLLHATSGSPSRATIESRARELSEAFSKRNLPAVFAKTTLPPLARAGGMSSRLTSTGGPGSAVATRASSSAMIPVWPKAESDPRAR